MAGYAEEKATITARLKRIEGQTRGIQRMVDEDRYCIEILDQISAVNRAMHAVALQLLESHLSHCVADALSGPSGDADAKVAEAVTAISRLVKS